MKLAVFAFIIGAIAQCPDYSDFSRQRHEPYSSGQYALSYQRPDPDCRTFASQDVEDTIARLESSINDPDLYRLFENSCTSSTFGGRR